MTSIRAKDVYPNSGRQTRRRLTTSNVKAAGVIPYTVFNNKIYFMLQRTIQGAKKNDQGWTDFGGKKSSGDKSPTDIAAREFSEETSCLFYLLNTDIDAYQMLCDNEQLEYDSDAIEILIENIPKSQKHFKSLLDTGKPHFITGSNGSYVMYFIKVDYIPSYDLPRAEDMHVAYDSRYIRECKWFSADEVSELNVSEFHKRLQIMKIKESIIKYNTKLA